MGEVLREQEADILLKALEVLADELHEQGLKKFT